MLRIRNNTGYQWQGWKRLNTDTPLLTGALAGNGMLVVAGDHSGEDTRHIDVHCTLEPGEERTLDLRTAATAEVPPVGGLPFRGAPMFGGVPLQFVSFDFNGAGWDVHLQCRVTAMLHCNVWLTYYPDQPSRCRGVLGLTASNCGVPSLSAIIPEHLTLDIPDALVKFEGLGYGEPVRQAGSTMADGQARGIPFLIVWPKHLRENVEFTSVAAEMSIIGICGNAIESLWPMGNPVMAVGTDAATWVRTKWPLTLGRMHTWQDGPEGVKARSGDVAKQEDQVFVGAECMAPGGMGAEAVLYLTALGQARRPCHHLEANGNLLDFDGHPNLVMWDSRAHYRATVSPDQLGKVNQPTLIDTQGWWGPDEEHDLMNTLAISARISGCPMLQWMMEAQARVFWFQKTVATNVVTSRPGAARAVGWEGLKAVHLWRGLRDRAIALRVKERFHARCDLVLVPQLGSRVADIWHVLDDPRLWADNGVQAPAWLPYQQAWGSWGLHLAGTLLGHAGAVEVALRGAQAVYSRAVDSAGMCWASMRFDGLTEVQLVEKAGAHYGENVWVWATPMFSILPEWKANYDRHIALQGGGKWVVPVAETSGMSVEEAQKRLNDCYQAGVDFRESIQATIASAKAHRDPVSEDQP